MVMKGFSPQQLWVVLIGALVLLALTLWREFSVF
jgi:hypothetical protein